MSAGRYDITIEQGATFTLSLTWEISGSAVNLSGYTASMQIIQSGGTVVDTLSSPTDITLGGSAGTIVVTIADDVTEDYDFNSGRYVLELTSAIAWWCAANVLDAKRHVLQFHRNTEQRGK